LKKKLVNSFFRKRNMKHEKDGNTYDNCRQVFEKVPRIK
jgi:hypothetical protein